MDSYIVRIYRRDDDQNASAGIVEVVKTQEQKAFKTRDELLAILNLVERNAVIVWEGK